MALLAACCMFLATLEYLIPKPLPFLRIGLSNLPLLLSLLILPFPSYLLLLFLKVLVQGLVQGTLFSYILLLSFCGTLASGLVMFALKKIGRDSFSLIGICVAGALLSNLIQLVIAHILFLGKSVWLIAPPFLIIGTLSGLLLGSFAQHFSNNSIWLKKIREHRDI